MVKWIYKKYTGVLSDWSEETRGRRTSDRGYLSNTKKLWSTKPTWENDRYVNFGYLLDTSRGYSPSTDSLTYQAYNEEYSYETDDYEDYVSYTWVTQTYFRERTYSKGIYVESTIAEDGTYPNDGEQDGYWYVKDRLAFPELGLKIYNELKFSEMGWVKIDGAIREIESIYTKISGNIKELI